MSGLPQPVNNPCLPAEALEKKAGELMLPLEYFTTVSVNTSLKDALFIFQKQGEFSNSLLVFKNKTLLGILRPLDILELLQPPGLKEKYYQGWHFGGFWPEPVFFTGFFTRRCLAIADKPVRDVMFTFTFSLQREDTLSRAIHLIIKHGVDLLPVRENNQEDNQVAGILRAREVFAEAGKILRNVF